MGSHWRVLRSLWRLCENVLRGERGAGNPYEEIIPVVPGYSGTSGKQWIFLHINWV